MDAQMNTSQSDTNIREWKPVTLGEVCTLNYGKALTQKNRIEGDIPVYSSAGLTGSHNEPLVNSEGIIIGRKGTVGKVYYTEKPFYCIDTAYYVLPSNEYNLKYLYYRLKTLGLEHLNEDSAVPGLNRETAYAQKFLLPSKYEQEKIADFVSMIDAKIEINESINRNLMEQANTIYKSTFIVNLNPDWPIGKLSDLITVRYGKDHKKLEDGLIPVYGSGGVMRYVERSLYEQESVLIPRKGSLNNVMYINEPFWSVDTMFYSEMKEPNVAKYVFHFLNNQDLASMNAGSAVPSMTTAILNAMEIRIPSADVLESYEQVVSPMYIEVQANNRESEKLGALRDALLPKLMSGELEVSNLEI